MATYDLVHVNLVLLFSQALEWFSTLMVEHTELFWSLFTVDVDAALDVQPPDTWDSFSLFQLLNDYFNKEREYDICGVALITWIWKEQDSVSKYHILEPI